MLFKSVIVSLAVAAAGVVAQSPSSVHFTSPVGDKEVYKTGSQQTFTWTNACTGQPHPTKVTVDLLDATNPSAAFFLQNVAIIDCTKSPGQKTWAVPSTFSKQISSGEFFALRMNTVPAVTYSGRFKIQASDKTSAFTLPTTTATTTSTNNTNILPTGDNSHIPSASVASGPAQTISGATMAVVDFSLMAATAAAIGLTVIFA